MSIRFNIINTLLMFGSCWAFTIYMQSAGVPNEIILVFSFLYGLLFPLRPITITPLDVDNKEQVGDENNDSSEEGKKDEKH